MELTRSGGDLLYNADRSASCDQNVQKKLPKCGFELYRLYRYSAKFVQTVRSEPVKQGNKLQLAAFVYNSIAELHYSGLVVLKSV